MQINKNLCRSQPSSRTSNAPLSSAGFLRGSVARGCPTWDILATDAPEKIKQFPSLKIRCATYQECAQVVGRATGLVDQMRDLEQSLDVQRQ
ncbi:MAG: hypothetical protein K2Y51_17375 [Gammaproteobacteria bacterium]|nr:hypothetical protein [Gammaproteobacteria bacterium]